AEALPSSNDAAAKRRWSSDGVHGELEGSEPIAVLAYHPFRALPDSGEISKPSPRCRPISPVDRLKIDAPFPLAASWGRSAESAHRAVLAARSRRGWESRASRVWPRRRSGANGVGVGETETPGA